MGLHLPRGHLLPYSIAPYPLPTAPYARRVHRGVNDRDIRTRSAQAHAVCIGPWEHCVRRYVYGVCLGAHRAVCTWTFLGRYTAVCPAPYAHGVPSTMCDGLY